MRVTNRCESLSRWAAAALGALLLAGTTPAAPLADARGTYRLQGRVRVDARPFPAHEDEIRADAVLSPAGAGKVLIHLAGQGLACELAASLDPTGTIALAEGQRCISDLNGEGVEGHVEARLVSGKGSLRGEILALELAFALSGTVRLHTGGALAALGGALSLPGAGGDPVPVRGEARGRAEGRRDRSKAAR